ncbi:hypothetical protein PoB_004550300 [Plakobranchus ocellatus]|uniref:Uncharacterized protein n=1 Tax=Plakobranchus ocellatus TaxID=259542 RepID=A0AAV4BHC2_9GAST|nr:hypothetical protein PoB_004550300 [Plakobranchus ocellatus]
MQLLTHDNRSISLLTLSSPVLFPEIGDICDTLTGSGLSDDKTGLLIFYESLPVSIEAKKREKGGGGIGVSGRGGEREEEGRGQAKKLEVIEESRE